MSDKPVWLEEWSADETDDGARIVRLSGGGLVASMGRPGPTPSDPDSKEYTRRLQLAASAPALARALLLAEWANNDDEDCCPVCGELKPEHDRESTGGWTRNGRPCALDAALTLANFPDQASRDAAREMIRKETT